jgi:hypothetical protein
MRDWLRVLGGIAIVAGVLLTAWLAIHFIAGPGEDATELVRRASKALRQVAVKGTVRTIARTPQGERRIEAKMHRGDGRFVMRFLNGPREGTEVHRQNGAVWVERESGGAVRRADVGDEGMGRELLERNWTFTSEGTRRVAGRWATLVRGTGPGGAIELAVDRKTGFPLHISRRDPNGQLISQTTWTEADFSVAAPPKAEPPSRGDRPHRKAMTLEEVRAAAEFTVHEPGWLPEGWELQGWFMREGRRGQMVQARYSDGLRPMVIIQLNAKEIMEKLRERREQITERRRQRQEAGERRRQPRSGGQASPERREAVRKWLEQRTPQHLRGAGMDASRRVIDGTVVIVIGPIGEEQRERVLSSMAGDR